MARKTLAPHRLPLGTVRDAALACGIPVQDLVVRHFGDRSWKVEVISPWGWKLWLPGKVAKAREIADRLEAQRLVCAFDVLDTGGFDVIFERA
jgi:hypothetical protein